MEQEYAEAAKSEHGIMNHRLRVRAIAFSRSREPGAMEPRDLETKPQDLDRIHRSGSRYARYAAKRAPPCPLLMPLSHSYPFVPLHVLRMSA